MDYNISRDSGVHGNRGVLSRTFSRIQSARTGRPEASDVMFSTKIFISLAFEATTNDARFKLQNYVPLMACTIKPRVRKVAMNPVGAPEKVRSMENVHESLKFVSGKTRLLSNWGDCSFATRTDGASWTIMCKTNQHHKMST